VLDEPQLFGETAHGLGVIEGARRVALLHPRVHSSQCLRRGRPVSPAEVGKVYPRSRVRSKALQRSAMVIVVRQHPDSQQTVPRLLPVTAINSLLGFRTRCEPSSVVPMSDGDHDII